MYRYQDKPQIAAISAIKAARKRCLKEDLVEQRKYGEENCITPRTRKSMYEQACHDFRKGDGPITKTRSVLLEQRRRDKIEYDRTYFAEYERTFPRYSDAEGYWWKKNRDYPPELAKPTRGDVIVPDLKVTEAVVPDAVEFVRPAGPADRLLGQTSSKGKQEDENPYASHAGMKVKESISLPPLYKKHYLGVPERNQKRLFDVIAEPNAKSNHLDDYCLDTHSSMRSVRENSREKKIRDRRQKGYNRGGVPGMVSELSPKHHNNASLTSTLTQNSQNGPENGQKQYSIYHRQDLSSTNSASGGNKNSSGGPNSGNNSGKGTRAASVDHNGTNRGSGGTRNTGTSNSGTISRQSWYLQGDSRKNSRKNSYAPTLLEQVGGVSHLGQYNSLNQSLDNALLENRSVVVSVANQPMQGSVDASRKTHVAGYGYYGNQSSNVSKQSAGGAHSNYLGNSYNYMSQHGPIVGGNSGSQQTLNLTGSQSVPNLGASVGATGVMTTKVSPPKKLNVVRKDTGGVPIMLGLAGYPGGAAAESGGAVRAPPHPDAMSPVAGGRGAKGRGRAGRAPSTRDPAKKEQEKPERYGDFECIRGRGAGTHYSDKRAPAVVAAKAVREGGFVHGAAIPANVSALVMDDGKHHPCSIVEDPEVIEYWSGNPAIVLIEGVLKCQDWVDDDTYEICPSATSSKSSENQDPSAADAGAALILKKVGTVAPPPGLFRKPKESIVLLCSNVPSSMTPSEFCIWMNMRTNVFHFTRVLHGQFPKQYLLLMALRPEITPRQANLLLREYRKKPFFLRPHSKALGEKEMPRLHWVKDATLLISQNASYMSGGSGLPGSQHGSAPGSNSMSNSNSTTVNHNFGAAYDLVKSPRAVSSPFLDLFPSLVSNWSSARWNRDEAEDLELTGFDEDETNEVEEEEQDENVPNNKSLGSMNEASSASRGGQNMDGSGNMSASSSPAPDHSMTECMVCLETSDAITDLGGGVRVTLLCGHSFHSMCLKRWLDQTCPVCRFQQYPGWRSLSPEEEAMNFCEECAAQVNAAAPSMNLATSPADQVLLSAVSGRSATLMVTGSGGSGAGGGGPGSPRVLHPSPRSGPLPSPHQASQQQQQLPPYQLQTFLCLVCGFTGCNTHAFGHYEQNPGHAYALDNQTQRVYDFSSETYVYDFFELNRYRGGSGIGEGAEDSFEDEFLASTGRVLGGRVEGNANANSNSQREEDAESTIDNYDAVAKKSSSKGAFGGGSSKKPLTGKKMSKEKDLKQGAGSNKQKASAGGPGTTAGGGVSNTNIVLEFNQLLTTQLEQQRLYFEDLLERKEQEVADLRGDCLKRLESLSMELDERLESHAHKQAELDGLKEKLEKEKRELEDVKRKRKKIEEKISTTTTGSRPSQPAPGPRTGGQAFAPPDCDWHVVGSAYHYAPHAMRVPAALVSEFHEQLSEANCLIQKHHIEAQQLRFSKSVLTLPTSGEKAVACWHVASDAEWLHAQNAVRKDDSSSVMVQLVKLDLSGKSSGKGGTTSSASADDRFILLSDFGALQVARWLECTRRNRVARKQLKQQTLARIDQCRENRRGQAGAELVEAESELRAYLRNFQIAYDEKKKQGLHDCPEKLQELFRRHWGSYSTKVPGFGNNGGGTEPSDTVEFYSTFAPFTEEERKLLRRDAINEPFPTAIETELTEEIGEWQAASYTGVLLFQKLWTRRNRHGGGIVWESLMPTSASSMTRTIRHHQHDAAVASFLARNAKEAFCVLSADESETILGATQEWLDRAGLTWSDVVEANNKLGIRSAVRATVDAIRSPPLLAQFLSRPDDAWTPEPTARGVTLLNGATYINLFCLNSTANCHAAVMEFRNQWHRKGSYRYTATVAVSRLLSEDAAGRIPVARLLHLRETKKVDFAQERTPNSEDVRGGPLQPAHFIPDVGAGSSSSMTEPEGQVGCAEPHVELSARTTSTRAPDSPRVVALPHSGPFPPSEVRKKKAVVEPQPILPSFTFVELFSGIGGFRVALEELGGTCVLACEKDEECRRTYSAIFGKKAKAEHNHNETAPYDPFPADVKTLKELPKGCGPNRRSVDLLVGGFPCQPFSTLGKQNGCDEDKGQLYLDICRLLVRRGGGDEQDQKLQPAVKAFILENVPGLQNANDGKDFKKILEAFSCNGLYHVTAKVVDAKHVTAQRRRRLYFVGVATGHQGLFSEKAYGAEGGGAGPEWGGAGPSPDFLLLKNVVDFDMMAKLEWVQFLNDECPAIRGRKNKDRLCNDNPAIEPITRVTKHQWQKIFTGRSKIDANSTTTSDLAAAANNQKREEKNVPRKAERAKKEDVQRAETKKRGVHHLGRDLLLFPNKTSKAGPLVSHYGHCISDGTSQLVAQNAPFLPRALGLRECLGLMGFPRDFLAAWEAENPGWKDTNPAARRKALRMVGNAVCPPLIALLAGAVLDHIRIDKNYRSKEVEEEVHFRFLEVEGEGERKAKTSRVLVSFRKTRREESPPHKEKTNWTRLGFHTAMRLAKKASLLGG
eukprot:g11266.t1